MCFCTTNCVQFQASHLKWYIDNLECTQNRKPSILVILESIPIKKYLKVFCIQIKEDKAKERNIDYLQAVEELANI